MRHISKIFFGVVLGFFFPAAAHANVGAAGFISISNMPAMAALQTTGLAMVIIILVEMLIFRRRQNVSYPESLKLLTLANIASLVAGYIILAILTLPLFNIAGFILIPWVLSRIAARVFRESGVNAWSHGVSKYLPFLVLFVLTGAAWFASAPVGGYLLRGAPVDAFFLGSHVIILCLFGIVSSAVIEAMVIVKWISNKKGLLATCLLMNLVSYAVLGVKFLPPLLNDRPLLFQNRAASVLASTARSPQELARDIVQQGWNLETQGRWDEAFALYNKALEVDPNCAVAYKHRGTVYTRKGAFEKAIPEFQKAAELDPTHASTFYNLGNLYLGMADYDRAIENFSKAIELTPGYTAAILNRASTYARKEEMAKAVEDYDRYLKILPKDKDAHLARASASVLMRDFDRALESFANAVALAPDDKAIYSARGGVYLFKKDFESAIADFRKVLELDPKDRGARVKLISVYIVAQKYDEAVADVDKLIEQDPQKEESYFYFLRGEIHMEKEDRDTALDDFNAAIEMDSGNASFYSRRAAVHLAKGDFEKSWADVAKVRELGGKVPDDFIHALESKSGDRDPDIRLKSAADYYDLYIRYYIQGYIKKSYETVQKALEVYPDDKEMLEIKAHLEKRIQEDFKGEIPEKIDIRGADFVLAMMDGAKEQARADADKGTAQLGPDGQSDTIHLNVGTITLTGPQGWEKKANFYIPNGSKMLILYSKIPGAALPSIGVSADKILPGVHSAVDFSRKMKDMMLRSDPPPEITEPQEQIINGHTASSMEIVIKGTHDISYRLAWYQFLFHDLIVTIQYHGSDYQLREGAPEFRKVVESLEFKPAP